MNRVWLPASVPLSLHQQRALRLRAPPPTHTHTMAVLQRHWMAVSGAGEGTLALGGKLDTKTIKITANYHSVAVYQAPTGKWAGKEGVRRCPQAVKMVT